MRKFFLPFFIFILSSALSMHQIVVKVEMQLLFTLFLFIESVINTTYLNKPPHDGLKSSMHDKFFSTLHQKRFRCSNQTERVNKSEMYKFLILFFLFLPRLLAFERLKHKSDWMKVKTIVNFLFKVVFHFFDSVSLQFFFLLKSFN